ncbi:MAG: DUF6492 family protein [Butyrivibrio sp.]|nr:DUF6492 family protein [Butyrivibrio sp.]
MQAEKHFDVLIVVTPADCERLLPLYPRLANCFKYGDICFIGRDQVGDIVNAHDRINGKAKWLDENALIPFDDVHACMGRKLAPLLKGEKLPRGITGWYYQQFLKMQYSAVCEDEYYMVWDGDTVPCREINMFSAETGQPYLDLKHEHHPEYFETMGKILPGFRKVIERSFISEHMLINRDIMRALISDIEKNDKIEGERFWEKIINCIEPEKIYDSSFSEFETYGTYVALRHPSVYKLREWHSFRLGASFFDINTICDRDFAWLGKDFDAISFEKDQSVSEENKNYFSNPEYQAKLSAKKMLQLAQMEYNDGYKEVWADDMGAAQANVRVGGYHTGGGKNNKTLIVLVSYNNLFFTRECIKSIRDVLSEGSYKIAVVDNGSTDGSHKWLSEQSDILYIRNEKNLGFGPACNQAVRATAGTEYADYDVFLLNNDTRLVFDALYFLKQALYSADDIGAVGSISNHAGNRQQVDVEFDRIDEYIKYGEKINVPMQGAMLERVRLSGFSMLVRRNLWDEIGGFDEDFVPGYFEDDVLCMEIMKKGFRLMVVRNSFIYHSGTESFVKINYNEVVKKNYALFKEKYGFDIMKYAYASGTVISQIPYDNNARFSVLQYGCGLGSELKAIKSLYPNSYCVGIETSPRLYDIARHTENVSESIDEFLELYGTNTYDVFIIEKRDLEVLSEEEQNLLSSLLSPNAAVLIKDAQLEEFPYENIRLIVWNMDDTFWQGVLSEGEVILPMSNADLIKTITDHGVVNSISSKNDEAKVMEELGSAGISELFVFNDINDGDIGQQLKLKLEAMKLTPETVLFVDANVRNREQAAYYCSGLETAGPEIIPYLSNFFAKSKAGDKDRKKLEHYRLLEKKAEARKSSASDEGFLAESKIEITVNRNCLEELDRIHELVMKSNRLNYTGNRDNKEILTRLITNDWNDCAYINVRDKFGDYGIVGFYCYNRWEKKMEHFLFSFRVLGMGVEQYVYNLLGCPDFEAPCDVATALEKDKEIPWIREDKTNEITKDPLRDGRARILVKGPRYMGGITPYLTGGSVTIELDMDDTTQNELSGELESKLFTNEYHVICYGISKDDIENVDRDIESVFRKLDGIYEGVKGNPMIILVSEDEINPVISEFAEDHDRMRVISISEYASGNAYFKIAGKVCDYINERISG